MKLRRPLPILLAVLVAGCSGNSQSTPTTRPAQPEPAVMFELADQKVTRKGDAVECEVKYRVIKGTLDPNAWYVCKIAMIPYAMETIARSQGKDLQTEGTFKHTFTPGKALTKEPVKYEIFIMQGPDANTMKEKVSRSLEGEV